MNASAGHRLILVVAAVLAALAVAMGAFAAHGLRTIVDARAVELVETASRYQLAHAIAVLAASALAPQRYLGRLLLLAGAVLFPGSLYALAFGAPRWIATIAPFGGALFVIGWLALGYAFVRSDGARKGSGRR